VGFKDWFKQKFLPWLAVISSVLLGVLMFIFGRRSLGGRRPEGSKQGGTDSASSRLRQQHDADTERNERERDRISAERSELSSEREEIDREGARINAVRDIVDDQRKRAKGIKD